MTSVSLPQLIVGACQGNVVSFPTDTVPALAVLPDRAASIFNLKQRSQSKPLILMGADPEDLWPYTLGSDGEREIWQQVARKHWPGALTLVLPATDRLPPQMNPIDPTTIGMRVPNSAIAIEILRKTGPLATTSANRSGEPPLHQMDRIEAAFPQVLTLSDVARSPALGVPSTVAKWTQTSRSWEILRQGAVELREEERA
ncbi:L-threonylcarbamoyladenylate synthase [Oscillatoriales cyanobacterium LEGE 11467]|uniref:L-threonylcarbamoyladenylate synthase n=1 Tax=Zarconia navalis LEGE 11467 TaxID=1828826 RepID=A0A928VSD4_9CYAN|nr:L-threonylcarbamoyladenylate synthase [Zarconia navalis]MBE9039514.1 L-threonylcarbamoyladenylate synthase [Zarconia navalis LEGE 11467]